jgi:hypothetical protein
VTLREFGQILREFWQSVGAWWESYLIEITTENVLDWSILNLILTSVVGIVALSIAMGILVWFFVWVSEAWEKSGLPYTWVRLDEKFGPLVAAFIMVCGTISFFLVLGIVFTLLEMM